MDGPEQQVTDSLGKLQLEAALVPLGWALTTPKDYGVDVDVEVFRHGKSTGITFKVQLKSSRSSQYSSAGDFVSLSLPVKNLRYLVNELRVPTVLVHADVQQKRTSGARCSWMTASAAS